MEVAKAFYFNGSDTNFAYYLLYGIYLYLPWLLFSLAVGFLAQRFIYLSLWEKTSLFVHVPIALSWAAIHVLILTSAYWVFWPQRVAEVSVGFVLGEQAVKWFHFEILAYFFLLGLWRHRILKSDAIQASSSTADGSGSLLLVTDSGVVKLQPNDIHWLLADDNYVIVHSEHRKIRVRGTMKDMLSQLQNDQFQQTHRSAIVNMTKVQEIGNQRLILQSGSRVPVSRRRHRQLVAAFNQ